MNTFFITYFRPYYSSDNSIKSCCATRFLKIDSELCLRDLLSKLLELAPENFNPVGCSIRVKSDVTGKYETYYYVF